MLQISTVRLVGAVPGIGTTVGAADDGLRVGTTVGAADDRR